MDVFLPIAHVSAKILVLAGVGGVVGLLSGLFGVGGGFLLTPLLMFLGVSPMVAAASDSAAIVAASTTGTLQHSRVGTVDYRMGLTLFAGGSIGSFAGVALGVVGGMLAALMGVGGGFIMVPLMLYVLRMRMHVVAGTSLLQILLTCMLVTVLQATQNHTVDVVLAVLLATGSTTGAVLGTRWGRRLRADQLKILLAVIVLGVAAKVTTDLLRAPTVLLSHVAGE
jgi:uncharacterized membrane protein YfcA